MLSWKSYCKAKSRPVDVLHHPSIIIGTSLNYLGAYCLLHTFIVRYASSLRQLKQHCLLLYFPPIVTARLASRLHQVSLEWGLQYFVHMFTVCLLQKKIRFLSGYRGFLNSQSILNCMHALSSTDAYNHHSSLINARRMRTRVTVVRFFCAFLSRISRCCTVYGTI